VEMQSRQLSNVSTQEPGLPDAPDSLLEWIVSAPFPPKNENAASGLCQVLPHDGAS
jgi:hypothetical protein